MTIAPFVQGLMADDPSLEALGITVLEALAGHSVVTLTVQPQMVNGHGITQGGYVFALADSAFAFAANSVLEGTATTDAQITYLAPSRVGEVLVAEAGLYFRDARRVVVDVTVRSSHRKIALFRGTGRALRARSTD